MTLDPQTEKLYASLAKEALEFIEANREMGRPFYLPSELPYLLSGDNPSYVQICALLANARLRGMLDGRYHGEIPDSLVNSAMDAAHNTPSPAPCSISPNQVKAIITEVIKSAICKSRTGNPCSEVMLPADTLLPVDTSRSAEATKLLIELLKEWDNAPTVSDFTDYADPDPECPEKSLNLELSDGELGFLYGSLDILRESCGNDAALLEDFNPLATKVKGLYEDHFGLYSLMRWSDQHLQRIMALGAGAYLAQLEPEGPTDEELISTYQAAYQPAWDRGEYHGCHVDGLRAVFRYGNRTPAPIPLSERQPTEADCDAEGRCW